MLSKRFLYLIISTLSLISLQACSSKTVDNRPVLAVSIEPQRNIVEHIVGDRYRVISLIPNGENPETFEPSASKRIDVENSDAYFMVGQLPFEKKLYNTAADKEKFLDSSSGIKLIFGTHYHEGKDGVSHEHRVADPHVWTSVRNVKIMAKNITDFMIGIDPANKDYYDTNLNDYLSHLDSIDAQITKRLNDSADRGFLVWHPSLSYFARDYDLKQVAVSAESKDLSVGAIIDVIEKAKAAGYKTMFYQSDLDSRQAETIAKNIGSRIVPLNPASYDWESELIKVADELAG